MLIYAEWELHGQFENGIFLNWDEYHAATFNPNMIIKIVRVIK